MGILQDGLNADDKFSNTTPVECSEELGVFLSTWRSCWFIVFLQEYLAGLYYSTLRGTHRETDGS